MARQVVARSITHLGTHVVVNVGTRDLADIAAMLSAIPRSRDFRRINQSVLPARTWWRRPAAGITRSHERRTRRRTRSTEHRHPQVARAAPRESQFGLDHQRSLFFRSREQNVTTRLVDGRQASCEHGQRSGWYRVGNSAGWSSLG
jgi:hypothetical protein